MPRRGRPRSAAHIRARHSFRNEGTSSRGTPPTPEMGWGWGESPGKISAHFTIIDLLKKANFKPFCVPLSPASFLLSTIALTWSALTLNLCTNIAPKYHISRFHVRIPLQHVSGQYMKSCMWNFLRQGQQMQQDKYTESARARFLSAPTIGRCWKRNIYTTS